MEPSSVPPRNSSHGSMVRRAEKVKDEGRKMN